MEGGLGGGFGEAGAAVDIGFLRAGPHRVNMQRCTCGMTGSAFDTSDLVQSDLLGHGISNIETEVSSSWTRFLDRAD